MNAFISGRSSVALGLLLAGFCFAPHALGGYAICQLGPPETLQPPTILVCACEGTPLFCYSAADRDNPETQLGAPEGAPTGLYQCCHTGRRCGSTASEVIAEDFPGCNQPDWQCQLGQPCSNGPGICQGTCKGNRVSVNEPGDGTLTVGGQGTYCDAPHPGDVQETCNGLDDDCDGVIDNVEGGCGDNNPPEDHPCPPDQCCDDDSISDSPIVNDPVHIGGGASYQRTKDVNIAGSIDNYALYRTYVSNEQPWLTGTRSDTLFLPKPFGASPTNAQTLKWWHSLYSFVYPDGWSASTGRWTVRTLDGALIQYIPCSSGQDSCFARLADNSRATTSKLYWTGGGIDAGYFVFFHQSGTRFVYASTWKPPADPTHPRFFLTRIEDKQYTASGGSPRNLASLEYGVPLDGNCPGLEASPTGVPYLRSLLTEDGAQLRFQYKRLPALHGMVSQECVLDSVVLVDRADGGTTEVPVAQYSYELNGSVETAGLLKTVTYPNSQRTESYAYSDGGTPGFSVFSNGTLTSYHQENPDRQVGSAASANEYAIYGYSGAAPCGSGSAAASCRYAQRRSSTISSARWGGVGEGAINFGRNYTLHWTDYSTAPKLYEYEDTCTGSYCAGASPGTFRWEWTVPDGGTQAVKTGVKDKRNNWQAYSYSPPSIGDVGVPLPFERTAIKSGATDSNGTNALEVERYGYAYGGSGQSPRAYEQLLERRERDSVLAPTGTDDAMARTKYFYDAQANRQRAVMQSGWTRRAGPTPGSAWTTEKKYRAVFYFSNTPCAGGGAADPLGRTLEAHGPCWADSDAATDCSATLQTSYPVTRYTYWPSTDSTNRRNRLKQVSQLPDGCQGSLSLDVQFNNYDAFANPTEVVDANGVSTLLSFEENRVKSRTVNGNTTRYSYDNGKLSVIQYPESNYEVFCYRTGTSGTGCTGGNWSEKLQWRANSGVADGATWSEKVVYTYASDGTIATQSFLDGSGQLRRVRKYAFDPQRRPTATRWGDLTDVPEARVYDPANNLAGIGPSYNLPPELCNGLSGSGTPVSTACSALSYDRANRLTQVDEFPVYSGSATRTCLDYDAHGNITSIKSGCTGASACSACTQPASTYKYDDFGNLVEAILPWTTGTTDGRGPIRYEYDASGNLLTKETETMRTSSQRLEYRYDALGRPVSASRTWALPSPGSETLYRLSYDVSQSLHSSCPQPANTKGRLLMREDSFGKTWYQYDAEGRPTAEIRLRGSTSTCSADVYANPHTFYSYTLNGNLSQIVYPHGRTVSYLYGTHPAGSTTDRVSDIRVTTWDGTAWTPNTVISRAAWEPYGALRGYQINHPASGDSSAIEYALGDRAGDLLYTNCSAPFPSSDYSDHSGRLRGLWVSTGNFTPGSGNGAIYKRLHAWKGDQVAEIATCLLGATQPRHEKYQYDQLLRLTSADRPAGNFATTGGAFSQRLYGYDGRGNRTSETSDACSYAQSYGISTRPDLLTSRSSSCAGSNLSRSYQYDNDGRVSQIQSANDSSGSPAKTLSFDYSPGGAATETVYKAVSVNGAIYGYYYDALGRRRAKSYPGGTTDEYFTDLRSQLLVDQGSNTVITPVGFYTGDDYVWLDGRPLILVRGKFAPNWSRLSDSSADCARNGEPAACGVYFPVTDHIGKPVLMLDSSRKVAGAADYDPFGHVNRVSYNVDTPHPYTNSSNLTIGDFTQALGGPSVTVKLRVLFDVVDTEQDHATLRDYASLADGDTGSSLTGPIGGYHRGPVWSPWVQPSAGRVAIKFTSDAANCCPDGFGGIDCACGQMPNFPYKGVTTESYEYQRYQTGTVPFWTPVRFPGQYFDAETDLFENWNRYYNPSIGRYLQPEPLLRQPRYIAAMSLRGHSVPSYSYALNNPIRFFDRNGLWAAGISLDVDLIFPLLSGGGGSFGINLVYTSENGLGLFVYHPSKAPSTGFSAGLSLQVCGGPGKGPWSGEFDNYSGSFGPISGGYYESTTGPNDPAGYAGFFGGLGIGAPAGLSQTRTNYVSLLGGK